MTDDELIERVAYKLFTAYDSGACCLDLDDVASAKEIINLCKQHHHQWISVDDELPKVGQYVHFVRNYKEPVVYGVKYEDVCGKQCFVFNKYQDDYWGEGANPMIAMYVTHWMPLPAPPEGRGRQARDAGGLAVDRQRLPGPI